ncbi:MULTISPECIES: AsnC family transcriptional regulator [unclassified Desulfovibrio]|uniref:siroheme decarboxylase subunit alpha n=1 Tax=unclassified Desulfovibrio TaxID=2593640 RepID=UPI0013EC04A2|nr:MULTISPECIES: AsnC family transcriptional regulator [unclassified Desulfovibrio]
MHAEAGKGAVAPQEAKTAEALDAVDRRILDIIQTGFPLAPRPYAVLGERLGLPEEEVFGRVRALRENKVIRRLGANFQSAKLGFVSTLCAAKVPEEKLEAFIAAVNAEPGVTHNYLRDHAYNIWFTLISPSREEARAVLEGLTERTGVPILDLPATKLFKIRVDFRMDGAPEER